MEPHDIIGRRIARELKSGMLVSFGIGIPTLVANHVPNGMHVFFQSENGMIGTGAPEFSNGMHICTCRARLHTLNSQELPL